jgi:endothelin-converting enzyme
VLLDPLISHTGIPALFEFGVEGDAGVDPNLMILWFQQPGFGLPSKVRPLDPPFSPVVKQISGVLRR